MSINNLSTLRKYGSIGVDLESRHIQFILNTGFDLSSFVKKALDDEMEYYKWCIDNKKVTKELASTLNGRDYLHELSKDEAEFATKNNLVVIYIDNGLFEVCGSINDSIKCYNGLTIYLDQNGIQTTIDSECYQTCEQYRNILKSYKQITPIWIDEGIGKGDYWKFETDIPHETFEIFKDGDIDCVGAVLSLDDLKEDTGKISDGYHTFDELYYHRMILFSRY